MNYSFHASTNRHRCLCCFLSDCSLYPNHVCQVCCGVINPFLRLRQVVQENERFLLEFQEKIRQSGIAAVQNNHGKDVTESKTEDCLENDDDYDDENIDNTEEAMDEEDEQSDANFNDILCDVKQNIKIKDEEEIICCQLCGKSNFSKSGLAKHLRRVHGKVKVVDCEAGCEAKFGTRSAMKRHVRNVHQDRKTLCNKCGESFKDINYHIKSVHENVNFPCDQCNKKYLSKQGLDYHIKHSHSDFKKSVCQFCAVEVTDVKNHIKLNHSGKVEKTIPCKDENCDKMFRTKQEARTHYNAGHLNKKEMCPLCGGWYKNLYTHIHQIHQAEKKHICDECGKAFGKKHDLKVHIDRVHLLKRYVCPRCGKTISKIREHLKTVHNVTEVNMDEIKDLKFDSEAGKGEMRSEVRKAGITAMITVQSTW